MTNGDAIKNLFHPREDQIKVYGDWVEIEIQKQGINFSCELKWWNAPARESKESATVAIDTQEITWDDTKEIYSKKETLDILNEIRDLAKGESMEVPMVYGDGTPVTDKMISLTKLGYILSEMEMAVKEGPEEDITIQQEEHDL